MNLLTSADDNKNSTNFMPTSTPIAKDTFQICAFTFFELFFFWSYVPLLYFLKLSSQLFDLFKLSKHDPLKYPTKGYIPYHYLLKPLD